MTSLWPFSNYNECVAWNCNRISTRHRPTWCKFVMLCALLYAQNRDEKKNSCKTYAKLQRTAFLVHWMVGSTWRSRAAIPEIGAFMNYYDTCLDNWCKRSANLFFFSCLFHFEREAPQRLQHQTGHTPHALACRSDLFPCNFCDIRLMCAPLTVWYVVSPSASFATELVPHRGAQCFQVSATQSRERMNADNKKKNHMRSNLACRNSKI